MTLDMLFVIVVPVYLVLVAYGQVGSRRRGLSVGARGAAAVLRVLLPPAALLGALAYEGGPLLRVWSPVVLAMAVAGAVVALLVEVVARRIGA